MRRQQLLAGLPTTADISSAPERAVLATLDASIHLGIHALRAAHPSLEDLNADSSRRRRRPLLELGESILRTAWCLHDLLAEYDRMLDRLDHRRRSAVAPTPAPACIARDTDDDTPF